MRIAVTGASGFLGCHLVRRLIADGHQVTLLASPRFRPERLAGVEQHCAIVAGTAAAVQARPEVIYHLASTSFNPPGTAFPEHFRVIAGQTAELLDAFAGTGTRFVYTGSGAEYGSGFGLDETHPLEPATLLGGCKAAASTLVRAFGRMGQLFTVVLRLFTPFGPWEPPYRLIPSIVRAAQRGERPQLSSGSSTRDFCYAADAVEALLCAATAPLPAGSAINICSGRETSVREMARMTLAVLGHPVEIRERAGTARPDEIQRMSGSNRAAAELLGWKPSTPLIEGIERTVSWFQQNPQWLRIVN